MGRQLQPPEQLLDHHCYGRAQEIQLRLHIALASDGLGRVIQQAPHHLFRQARLDADCGKGVPERMPCAGDAGMVPAFQMPALGEGGEHPAGLRRDKKTYRLSNCHERLHADCVPSESITQHLRSASE